MTLAVRCSGATLLELLVVMTLMMTLLGLVGSGTVNGVARAQAQTEVITVYALIKKTGVRAFASGRTLEMMFDADAVTLTHKGRILHGVSFKHLFFAPQKITINRNGYPNKVSLTVDVRGVTKNLELSGIFSQLSLTTTLGRDDVI